MVSLRAKVAAFKARSRYAGKKARMARRTTRRPFGRRAMSLQKFNVHSYKRMATAVTYTCPSSSTAYNNSFAFTLSEVRNSAELTALYDQYMITGVKIMIQLVNNPDANNSLNSGSIGNASNFYPKLFYVRDYDDLGVEATDTLRERNNVKVKILRPDRQITFFVKPALRNQLYLDGVTPANSPVWNQWLDCSATNVPHYGVKFSVEFNSVTTIQDYFIRVEKVYYVKFKNSR